MTQDAPDGTRIGQMESCQGKQFVSNNVDYWRESGYVIQKIGMALRMPAIPLEAVGAK